MYTQGHMLEFTVYGVAQPAGSKRAFVNKKTGRAQVVDANSKSKPWQAQVAAAATEAMDDPGLMEGPLGLGVVVFAPRPKSHYGTGKNAGVVKDSAPDYPATRPDLTKLLRGIEDALTGIVWRDDAQVVLQVASKQYGEPARVEIAVSNDIEELLS